MSRWVQLDRMHLKKRGFLYKIPLLILVVAALVMGYHHVTGKPALRDVIEITTLNSITLPIYLVAMAICTPLFFWISYKQGAFQKE